MKLQLEYYESRINEINFYKQENEMLQSKMHSEKIQFETILKMTEDKFKQKETEYVKQISALNLLISQLESGRNNINDTKSYRSRDPLPSDRIMNARNLNKRLTNLEPLKIKSGLNWSISGSSMIKCMNLISNNI
jgi:hypothetical protein